MKQMKFQSEPGRFFLEDEQGQLTAEVTYQQATGKDFYILDHTFVDPSLRGQGVAGQLVKAVVDKARADHKQILFRFARMLIKLLKLNLSMLMFIITILKEKNINGY
jgi:predicted GNAT family acetyltransferase